MDSSTGHVATSGAWRITTQQKALIELTFGRHISQGQVRYLKAGRLDILEAERSGVAFVDAVRGQRFIDCFTSAGCFNVGRRNPVLVEALREAALTKDIGVSVMVSEERVALAELLAEIAPGDLERVHFAAGGGDAVDCALKLARGATGRTEVISTIKAYHGHTGFALSANGKAHYRSYCEPLIPGFRFAPFNDLEAVRALTSHRTAAIMIEPVQGEAGIFVGTPEFLRGLRELCDQTGAMLIFDEIQTGFGRTGRMFATEHTGVVPDIMTLAKSFGGGLYPNAAVMYRPLPRLLSFLDAHPDFHPSIAGGTDLGCRLALSSIDYILKNRLAENAERMGERLRLALVALREENPGVIREVRGQGLMIGIEYLHEFMGPMMAEALARNGVFAAYSGNAPQVMRFMVPIVIRDDEMDLLLEAIRGAVQHMKRILPIAVPAARLRPVLRLLNDERMQTLLFGWLRRIEEVLGGRAASNAKVTS